MHDIDIFNNTQLLFNRKHNFPLVVYIIIVIIIFILGLIIITKYEFQIEKTYHGTINDNEILLLIKQDDLNILTFYDLYINNEKTSFTYQIDGYVTDISSTIYYKVIIKTKSKIMHSKCVFRSKKTTILKELKGK